MGEARRSLGGWPPGLVVLSGTFNLADERNELLSKSPPGPFTLSKQVVLEGIWSYIARIR